MFEHDLPKKTYRFTVQEALLLVKALSFKKSKNQNIWKILLEDMDHHIQSGGCSNLDIFYLIRSLDAVDFLQSDVVKHLVDYLVKRGYDSDDLMALSS